MVLFPALATIILPGEDDDSKDDVVLEPSSEHVNV